LIISSLFITFSHRFLALNGLICADVPLRNYSLTHHSRCGSAEWGRHQSAMGCIGWTLSECRSHRPLMMGWHRWHLCWPTHQPTP